MVYLACISVENRKLFVIPISWCFGIDIVRCLNDGIRQRKNRLVFWSKDQTKVPNFCLKVQNQFDGKDACYIANILKVTETRAEANEHVDRRREILPVDYANNVVNENLHSIQQEFIAAAIEVEQSKIKEEKNDNVTNDGSVITIDDSFETENNQATAIDSFESVQAAGAIGKPANTLGKRQIHLEHNEIKRK